MKQKLWFSMALLGSFVPLWAQDIPGAQTTERPDAIVEDGFVAVNNGSGIIRIGDFLVFRSPEDTAAWNKLPTKIDRAIHIKNIVEIQVKSKYVLLKLTNGDTVKVPAQYQNTILALAALPYDTLKDIWASVLDAR